MKHVVNLIYEGSINFIKQEIIFGCIFVLIVSLLIVFFAEETLGEFWIAIPFLIGAAVTMVIKFIAVLISLNANLRILKESSKGLTYGFEAGLKASTLLSFSVHGI